MCEKTHNTNIQNRNMARVVPITHSNSMRKMMQIAKDQSNLEEMLKRKKLTRTHSATRGNTNRGNTNNFMYKRRRYSTGGYDAQQGPPPTTNFQSKIRSVKSSRSRNTAKRRRYSMSAASGFTRSFQSKGKKLNRSNSMTGQLESNKEESDLMNDLNPPHLSRELGDIRDARQLNRELSLTLKKNLANYNKDEDEDVDLEVEETFPFYIILPDDMKRMAWDIVIVILVLYVACVQPLRIGFPSNVWDSSAFATIDVISDVFFLIDFFTCFFTAYIGDRGNTVASLSLIAKRHIFRLGFVADVLTAIPWSLIERTHIMSLSRIMLMSRTSRIVECLRLVRIVRLRLIWSSFEDFFQLYHQYTEMISTFVVVIFMVHLNACFFTYVNSITHL